MESRKKGGSWLSDATKLKISIGNSKEKPESRNIYLVIVNKISFCVRGLTNLSQFLNLSKYIIRNIIKEKYLPGSNQDIVICKLLKNS